MKSIRSKVFWSFSAVVLGILILTVLINSLLFKPFSIRQDRAIFTELEQEIHTAAQSGLISTELLADLSAAYGVQLDVVNRESNQIIYSSSGLSSGQGHRGKRYRTSFGRLDLAGESELGFRQLQSAEGEEVLMLISALDPQLALVVYRPVSMIDRSVAQANRFVGAVGFFLLALGGLVIYWLAGRSVRPILQLQEQTENIAKLDFSGRFESRGADEIAQLGKNINAISDKLSQTIGTLESDVEKLTEVDKVRKQFIASVSHEFKSPLGIIKGYTEALKYQLVAPEAAEKYYDTIIGETDRMDQLVQDLILLMRHELQQHTPQLEAIALCDVLSQILERHRAIQPERSFKLYCEPVMVFASPAELTRVMDNFLQNAYRYGEINSAIDLRVEYNAEQAVISIQNRGPRIAEDQRQAIWQSFYKTDPARSAKTEGTGLGLAINKALIEAMGGQVGFDNTADGVRFYCTLQRVL